MLIKSPEAHFAVMSKIGKTSPLSNTQAETGNDMVLAAKNQKSS